MNHDIPTPSPALAAHIAALPTADAALADAAQQRLLAALPTQHAPRRGVPRGLVAAASFCAVLLVGVALFLGEQGNAFAAVQQRLRDFTTLRLQIDQHIDGETLPQSTLLLDRSGSLRTDVGSEVSVIVDTRAHAVLTLLHGPRLAMRMPLPAGTTPQRDDALQWLDAIREFQGEAQPLPQPRTIDGAPTQGWRLHSHGMQIDLWADADGVPRAMQVGGAQGLTLDYRFVFDVPIDPALLSAQVPAGYTLGEADDD
jgi:hypothetical protein